MARPWSARCYGVARQREGSGQNSIGGPPRLPYLLPLARARALLARPVSGGCYGVARQREGSRQNSIGGAPRLPYLSPLARARALMARPWSAGCYGVARQREGSRQNGIGGSGVLSLRHFSGWFSLSPGAWVPKQLARRRMQLWLMASAGAMLLDRLG